MVTTAALHGKVSSDLMLKPSLNGSPKGVRPEAELLLCCARTSIDTQTANRIKTLLQQDIDWAYTIQMAESHKLPPLLYWSLNNICPEGVPNAFMEQLRTMANATAYYNLFLAAELNRLLELLSSRKIPALPFKGPVLASSAYGNLSLRQFDDLDILLHKHDFRRAKDLLLDQGYREMNQVTEEEEAAHLRSPRRYHCMFVRDDKKATYVELHWGVTAKYFSFPLDHERLWESLESVPLAGSRVLNFPAEDLLLYLCVHGSKHLWGRLLWICDVAELIRSHSKLDWNRVLSQASAHGSQRMLFMGLFLANDLLGIELPNEVSKMIQADGAVKLLTERVRERLFRENQDSDGFFEKPVFYFKMREGLGDKARLVYYYCLKYFLMAVTPNKLDEAIVSLPGSFSFLYYLLRPVRLIRDYGKIPLKRFRNLS